MLAEFCYHKCLASQDWLSVRYCRSRRRSKKTLTHPSSSLTISLCFEHFLSSGNWVAWCCSWVLPRSQGPKSSGCNKNRTQFSLRCVQPWRRSAGLPRWNRCIWSKHVSLSFSLPSRTHRHRTSTLFRCSWLQNNWLRACWDDQECSCWGSWRGLLLNLKCC